MNAVVAFSVVRATLGRLARRVPASIWFAAVALIGVLILVGHCTGQARQDERRRAAADHAAAYARQLKREAAADERASARRIEDMQISIDRTEERNDDARSQPDGVPDDRELRRRCRQLRDSGIKPTACQRFAG